MVPGAGSKVWVERCKFPDVPHYGAEGYVLGEDACGVWAGSGAGHPVWRGGEQLFIGERPVVWCLPRDDWFMTHFIVGHPQLDIYIDVVSPPTWTERGATMVDLDFDIVVWNDGRPVELVDEDEFEQHRVELGYPDDLVAGARAAARDAFDRARSAVPPFTKESAQPWIETLRALTQNEVTT